MTTTSRPLGHACFYGAAALLSLSILAGCSVLPAPPATPVVYDFGPGPLAAPASDRRAPLPPLALADVEVTGFSDNSTAVLYRLAYSDAQQLRPYMLARWSLPPAQLLQRQLRDQLGQRRVVISADAAPAQALQPSTQTKPAAVLRVELEEFSHLFRSATDSAGVVRLRATVVDLTASGEVLRGQRVFIASTPARSADAVGGVAALAQASTQVAQELAAWVEQTGR